MITLSDVRHIILPFSLFGSLGMASNALANPNLKVLTDISPEQIASDSEKYFNRQTGIGEIIAPSFDPFESQSGVAGTVSLRSTGTKTSLDGRTVTGGALLDMSLVYVTGSNDPHDNLGFERAAFLSGDAVTSISYDNRILECSEKVRETVYDDAYYNGAPYGYLAGVYRHYPHYRGHSALRYDYSGFGYGYGHGFGRRLGHGFGHGFGHSVGRGFRRGRFNRGGRFGNRVINQGDNIRGTGVVGNVGNGVGVVGNVGNGVGVVSVPNGRNVRAEREQRLRNRSRGRRIIGDNRRGFRALGDSVRGEEIVAGSRTDPAASSRSNSNSGVASGRRPNKERLGTQPTQPPRPNQAQRQDRARSQIDRSRSRSRSQIDRGRTQVNRSRSQIDRGRSSSRQSGARESSRQRSRQSSQNSRQRPISNQRSIDRSVDRNFKSRNSVRRHKTTGRPVLNFFPVQQAFPVRTNSYNRSSVHVTHKCAREESLTIYIPTERLEAARYDGFTVLVLDRDGRETPLYVPPNYVEGFRLASQRARLLADETGVTSSGDVYGRDQALENDYNSPPAYTQPSHVPNGYPQNGN